MPDYTCRKCGKSLEVPAHELEAHFSEHDPKPEREVYVRCPECGADNYFTVKR